MDGKRSSFHKNKIYLQDLDTAIAHIVDVEKLDGRSVLVTGVTGTIGSFVTDVLLRYNQMGLGRIEVYIAGRNVQKIEQEYGLFRGCIALPYALEQEICFDIEIDYIIHAAGNAHPAAFNGDPVGTILNSINSTYRLLEYGRNHRAQRLLYISSGEVYGQGDLSIDEFEENDSGYLDVQSPRSCYPMAKRATENLCASYSKQYGLETVAVRPCHTYGPCITPFDSRAHAQFIRNVLNNEDIVMTSTGTQLRSYNYVADCASALLSVLLCGKSEEAYNTANPRARCTIAELAGIIASVGKRKVIFAAPNTIDLANRTPVAKQVLSSKKIETLGWKGSFSIEDGISHTIRILQGE